jgi:pimeloyl-ACP methyl ester carboxylesterase
MQMQRTILRFAAAIGLVALSLHLPTARAQDAAATGEAMHDVVLTFHAADGTPLAGKLTLPGNAGEPVPVVFYLHGAGPSSYESYIRYVDDTGERHIGRYFDFHARELASRGVGFFRMGKRGCDVVTDPPSNRLDNKVFAQATMSVLLSDYEAGLDALRQRTEIDAERIILLGSSEGTRLAPQLALRSPSGVIGIAMIGYAQDNARDTIIWQNSVGMWRSVQHLIPAAREGRLTRAAYDEAVKADPSLAAQVPFDALDADGDGVLSAEDVATVIRPRLDAILQAVKDRNDELLAAALMHLTSAYLLEWWDAEPNHITLLKLDMPLAIFHGKLDNTTRVEGVYETEAALNQSARTNLTVHLYADGDHNLNWSWRALLGETPPGYADAFRWIAQIAGK